MGRPFPVTVERLAEWAAEIEKRGIVLVPITVLGEETVRGQLGAARAEADELRVEVARLEAEAVGRGGPGRGGFDLAVGRAAPQ